MSVVDLASTKRHLTITATTHDAELQSFIDTAEAAIGERVGPLAETTHTARVRGGGKLPVLTKSPAISMTSVNQAEATTAITPTNLHLDPNADEGHTEAAE